MDDTPEFDYQVDLKIEDIYLLHHCVEETFKNHIDHGRQTGIKAPARPAEEQEHLRYLRDSMYRMILEYRFDNM